MQTKASVFADIQQILKYDYAKCQHRVDHDRFVVTPQMSDSAFIDMLEDYVAAFEDPQLSIEVKHEARPNIGFSVRYYEDKLYVVEASEETRLHIGDTILAIDRIPVAQIARQQWQRVLMRATNVTVQQKNCVMTMTLSHYERQRYNPVYEAKMLADSCLYMKFTDFGERYPVQQLLAQYDIATVDHLVLDMRQHYGGNDVYMYPLLDYVFDAPQSLKALYQYEKEYTNFTPRNCQLLLQLYEDYLREPLDAETIRALDHEMFQIEQHRGQGFVEVTQDVDYVFEGSSMPKHVYILTDTSCTGAGEMLVALAKKSSKVTVLGRPTKGTMATFNVVSVDFGDIVLYYPTSKMDEASMFASNDGIKPHVEIPWTPQQLIEDIDLKTALSFMNTSM